MDAMAKMRVPAVVAPGCLDMANFGEFDTVPEQYKERNFYIHNPQVTLMRTNEKECAELGEILAKKTNANQAATAILLPLKGVSVIAQEGQPFYDKQADEALFNAIRNNYQGELIELDCDINDSKFAMTAANTLIKLINDHQ